LIGYYHNTAFILWAKIRNKIGIKKFKTLFSQDLEAAGLPDAVFGSVDFLELLLSGLADVLAQGCHLVGMMLKMPMTSQILTNVVISRSLRA
jgi:hypothetical protein